MVGGESFWKFMKRSPIGIHIFYNPRQEPITCSRELNEAWILVVGHKDKQWSDSHSLWTDDPGHGMNAAKASRHAMISKFLSDLKHCQRLTSLSPHSQNPMYCAILTNCAPMWIRFWSLGPSCSKLCLHSSFPHHDNRKEQCLGTVPMSKPSTKVGVYLPLAKMGC